MLHDKNKLFIHIPKTAGTSVRHFLLQNNLEKWNRNPVFTYHDPIFLLEQNNDLSNTFKFTVIRNPYTRAYSHYKHIQKYKNFDKSFNDFLNIIRINGHVTITGTNQLDYVKFNELYPLISFRQSFYLYDLSGVLSIDKIYRKERLHDFENDFNTTLPHLNKNNYTQEEYLKAYATINKNLVRNLFLEDFVNFNYSQHFDDSIEVVG
jgi:hypothetical protein